MTNLDFKPESIASNSNVIVTCA